MVARSTRSNQRPDTVMQDRINRVDEFSCTARPDHTVGSILRVLPAWLPRQKSLRFLPFTRGSQLTPLCRYCCKSILSISARNIESKSRTNAQHRFKSTYAPIRLLQISIRQRPFGDFCNNICQERKLIVAWSSWSVVGHF
jgi:hypothetical protein